MPLFCYTPGGFDPSQLPEHYPEQQRPTNQVGLVLLTVIILSGDLFGRISPIHDLRCGFVGMVLQSLDFSYCSRGLWLLCTAKVESLRTPCDNHDSQDVTARIR